MAIVSARAPQRGGRVKDVTTASFKADVLTASMRQPVLVDFWAPWCGPCKQLAPVLEKAVADSKGKVTLVKMNIDDHPQIAGQLGIQSIPAVIAFDKGQPVDGFMGALPESQVRGFIERLVGPLDGGADALLAEAEAAVAAGDADGRGGALRRASSPKTRPIRRRSAGLPSCMSTPAISIRPRRCCRWRRRPRRARIPTRRSRRRGRRCILPSRRPRSAISRRSKKRSRPIRTTIRRASTSRSRSTPRAIARRGGRPSARNHQARARLERGRRAQAIVAVLRSVGPDGRGDDRGAAKTVGDLVLRPGRGRQRVQTRYETQSDLSRRRPNCRPTSADVSGRGGAAAAAPADPVDGVRAALSRHARRCAERRAADRHDPAERGRRRRPEPRPNFARSAAPAASCNIAEIGDGRCFLTLMGVARFRRRRRS